MNRTSHTPIRAVDTEPLPARLAAAQHELAATARLLSDAKRRIELEERAKAAGVAMLLETLRLFEELVSSERRAQSDARVAQFKEERIRRRLAFRIGHTLLSTIRSPFGWLRLPGQMLKTYHAYQADKADGLLAPLPPAGDDLNLRRGRLVVAARPEWQRVVLPQSDRPADVWLTLLCAPNCATLTVDVETGGDSRHARTFQVAPRPPGPIEPREDASLSPGIAVRLLRHQGARVLLGLRVSHSISAVLKLELRPVIPSNRTETDASSQVKRLGSPSRPSPADPARAPIADGGTTKLPTGAASGAPASPGSTDSSALTPLPRPIHGEIIWQAAQLASEGRFDESIAFATRHAGYLARPAVHLLKANRALGHEREWLGHVNDYLEQFHIAPIDLRPTAGPLFSRLTAATAPAIERGPLITVIMPAYQAEGTIRYAVESILNQTWRPLELIVVDDCSRDGTSLILAELAARDGRLKVLRNDVNVGPYVSKNVALTVAAGEYLTGHDADDWAHPERLARHIGRVLQSDHQIKASITRMLRLNADGYLEHIAKEGKVSDDGALRDAAISCLFEASLFRTRLGHWDCVRFGADSEMIARTRRVCGPAFVNLRQMGMLCLDAEGSLTNDPVHGISKRHGVSETRAFYRDQWIRWHRTLDPDRSQLTFPLTMRPFDAPPQACVPVEDVERVIRQQGRVQV